MKTFLYFISALLGLPSLFAATFTADFNTGAVPAGSSVAGSAVVAATGGVGNTGVLKLTDAAGGQFGAWIINDFSSGAAINAFNATFKIELGNSSGAPADGFSLSWATDLSGGAISEEGEGTGLIVAFDTFDNGGGEAPAIDVKWNGGVLAHSSVPFDFSAANTAFVAVQVKLTNGLVTVVWNGVTVHSNISVPGFGSLSGAKFGFGGRTGAAFERHYVDDVSITTTPGSGSGSLFANRAALQTDADGNARVTAGDTLRYTVTFTNTFGSNLVNAILTDASFTNQNFVGGSLLVSPLGRADAPPANSVPGNAFHGTFNATLNVSAAAGLLTNDFLGVPAATIASFGGGTFGGQVTDHAAGTSANVAGLGTLTVNADGSLSFVPATGFTGPANFLYRLANSVGAVDVSATVAVGKRPMATNDSYNVTGNTMLDSSLLPLSVLANDGGDAIGAQSATAPAHGAVSFNTATGHFTYTPAAAYTGSDSFNYTLTNGFGGVSATVNLTIANKIWYIDNSVAANGDGRSSSPFKQTSDFTAVNDGGAGHPGNNDVVFLRQGSGNYTGSVALRSGQRFVGDGLTGAFASPFGFNLVSGSAKSAGVAVPGFTGVRPFISVASGTGVGLNADNQVAGMNVHSASGRAFSGASVGFLIISNATASAVGDRVLNLASGSVIVKLDSASSTNSVDNGINLSALGGAVTINGGAITGAASTDFIVGGSAANITYAGNLNNTASRSVDISGQTGGGVTLSGNITDTGTGLIVQNCTGGALTFSGTAKSFNTGANAAVTLSGNSGATINFSNGGLAITTTTGTGFTATGGAAEINVTGASNTINTGAGTALNVLNTTVGASGLSFQSISANGGGVSGIVLNNTGANGGLTVAGDGGASNNGSGGTIQAKSANVDAISLTNTRAPSLNYMIIRDNSQNGIKAALCNGITINRCNIIHNSDSSTVAPSLESGVYLLSLYGTAAINNTTISNSYFTDLRIENSDVANGSLVVNLNNNTIANTGASDSLANIFNFLGSGSANMTLNMTNTAINGSQVVGALTTDGLHADTSGGSMSITVTGCSFRSNFVAVTTSIGGTANSKSLTADIHDNLSFVGNAAQPINVFAGNTLAGDTLNAKIRNNIIGTSGVARSGSTTGVGIDVDNEGICTMNALITGNTVQQLTRDGIVAGKVVAAGTLNVTISGNTIRDITSDPGGPNIFGINTFVTFAGATICANISGNSFVNINNINTPQKIRVRQTGSGPPTSVFNCTQASVAALASANGITSGEVQQLGTVTFGQPACVQP